MSCSSSSASATVTIEPEVKRQRTAESDNDVPPLDDLLVALDVALRDEETEVENVIIALVARARADGVPAREYLALALLIGFKRRNHQLGLAMGMGAGERKLLRTVIKAISAVDADAVTLILPLVPLYGSWRDLLVLAEDLLPEGADSIAIDDLPVVAAICALFAEQMAHDGEAEASLPSCAAKYAPHEGRHGGGKSKLAAKAKILADSIAAKLKLAEGRDKHSARAAYRRLRAALNKKLAEAGHLLEPLLAAQRLDAIQFTKAPKGALAKVRKAIMKDPKSAARWKRAMARSTKAVPDLDDLVRAAAEALEEADEPDESLRLLPRRLLKAIDSIREQRSALRAKADALLEQVAQAAGGADAITALGEGASLPALPVVLSASGDGHARHELLLAAFLLARAQELPYVSIDGELVSTNDDVAAAAAAEAAPAAAAALPDWAGFLARVGNVRLLLAGAPASDQATRLLRGGKEMLGTVGQTEEGGRLAGDVVAICGGFSASAEPERLSGVVNELKADGMRLLLVHRVREPLESLGAGAAASGTIAYEPRLGLRPMPPRGTETIDVLFVLDLTGSMGPWIDQCKSHISSIIHALRDDLGVRTVRVAFTGYRDWGERNSASSRRVVNVDFLPMERVGDIVDVLRHEHAAGGGDGPEDVISSYEAACRFDWQGDVRVAVFIADAPAHGYSGSSRGGDDFPGGLCPDQHTKLPVLVKRLAVEHGVDLLCTKLSAYTDTMYKMFAATYAVADESGRGFGVLPIEHGASKFKAAILGSLSSALVALIAPSVDVPGVQTFDGQTVSALSSTLNASLRESVDAAAAHLRKPSAAAAEAAEAEHDEVVAAAEGRVAALEAEVAAADAALADEAEPMEEEVEEQDEGGGAAAASSLLKAELSAAKTSLVAAKARPKAARASRSDAARLRAALEAEELHPVRLALGLPLPTESLAMAAALALLRAGVCVCELQAKGYPEPFVKAMEEAAAVMARRV